jgi:hypothetical protein
MEERSINSIDVNSSGICTTVADLKLRVTEHIVAQYDYQGELKQLGWNDEQIWELDKGEVDAILRNQQRPTLFSPEEVAELPNEAWNIITETKVGAWRRPSLQKMVRKVFSTY